MSPAIPLRLMLVGDLILDEPDPDSFFEPARSVLHQADLLVGHVEVPHTLRGRENTSDVPAPPSDPGNLSARCFGNGGREVGADNVRRFSIHPNLPLIDPEDSVAQGTDRPHIVTYK